MFIWLYTLGQIKCFVKNAVIIYGNWYAEVINFYRDAFACLKK